ncbi:ferritin [Propionispora vibrioides]|uniref:Ferritin n=1 Tax=Propionispora vibrioides TaxID=112903 RepID=A0A1H8TEJ9_9FIRM|nr:ferritin [Propionispora vibrioides]SEO89529.1 ferritin [Propionispora vibrioides]
MISEKMQKVLNKQVQAEMYSANLYLAMSSYCDFKGLKGFANWLRVQYQEETAHALLLLDYVKERGGKVEVLQIEAPAVEFGTMTEVFKTVLKHEQHVTGLINGLYEVAIQEKDFAAQIFLQWFVNEQVEEEANATDILGKLEVIGDSGVNVLYLDKELSTRVFVPPSISNAN